jgi:FAD/FMN-containing dehydrogenase
VYVFFPYTAQLTSSLDDPPDVPSLLAQLLFSHQRFIRNLEYCLDKVAITQHPLDAAPVFLCSLEHRHSLPAARTGLRVTLRSLDVLAEAVAALLTQEPSAIELLDRTFLELVGEHGPEAVLLVEIEREDLPAARAAVEAAAAAVGRFAASLDTGLTPAATERLWALRHAASPILAGLPDARRSLQVIEDGCVPVARMGAYVRAVRQAAAARGLPVVIFGHAGDGHVHVNLLPDVDRPGWEDAVAELLDEVTDELVRLGGTPSGEHGDGRLRAPLLARVYGDEVVALFSRVKAAFDPLGILNPGVILPGHGGSRTELSISRLKVGAHAVALPCHDGGVRILRL